MFNFLNTSFLFAAAAALIPLLIHLFSKRKVKIIEFSSVRHLKAMQKRQVRKLKIRQLLLLLLRMLIIFIVVFAFARPTTESGTIGSHASVSAVILFDNSISMQRYVVDGNLFDIAYKRTEELLQNFGEADEVMLLPLVSSLIDPEHSFASAAAAREYLRRIIPKHEIADFTKAFSQTIEVLRSAKNLNKELYIISDLQRSSMPDSSYLEGLDASVYYINLPLEENENCGITSVDFGGQLIIPGHDFTLSAAVQNYGQIDQRDLIASLIIDGNRVAQSDFAVSAGNETTVNFNRSVSTTGFHTGYIEISDDKFTTDNRYYFSFKIPEQFNLLIIDGDDTGDLIKLALTPSQSLNQYWSVKNTTSDKLTGINFWDYDVIFLTGAPTLADSYIQRLKSFLSQGRSLFITYDGKTDIDNFNLTYSEFAGLTFNEAANLDFTRAGYYSFLSQDGTHPIFSIFQFKENKPPEIKFFTLPKSQLHDNAALLMSFTGNRPALVENKYKTGNVLTFAGPIGPQYTDLSASAFFVPFLSRIAEYLASDLSSYELEAFCGTTITRTLSDKVSVNDAITLITPDSTEYQLVPEDKTSILSVTIDPVDLPGFYSLYYRGKEIDKFSLNTSPEECNLDQVDIEQFKKAIGAETLLPIDQNVDLAATLTELRFGSELWQLFLWLAVILLALEMLLSRSRVSGEE